MVILLSLHLMPIIDRVINCIWKTPQMPMWCIWHEVKKKYLSRCRKHLVRRYMWIKPKSLLKLIAPEIISEDPSLQFLLFDGFPKLFERAGAKIAEACASFQHGHLIICTSSHGMLVMRIFGRCKSKESIKLSKIYVEFGTSVTEYTHPEKNWIGPCDFLNLNG